MVNQQEVLQHKKDCIHKFTYIFKCQGFHKNWKKSSNASDEVQVNINVQISKKYNISLACSWSLSTRPS